MSTVDTLFVVGISAFSVLMAPCIVVMTLAATIDAWRYLRDVCRSER